MDLTDQQASPVVLWTDVLVQRKLDKSTFLLRDCPAFGRKVFLGITKL
jgi:hypothetical protein